MTTRLYIAVLLALPALAQLPGGGEWKTDLSRRTIDLKELLPGGPPKDGIPSIDHPRFVPAAEARWLPPQELVISVTLGTEVRAYPLRILIWHELVNDRIAETPLLVSFCPLCNSAIVFDRRVDGRRYEFGVTGMLRNTDMIMYDRETESLWQQITGEALVGTQAGRTLRVIPSQVLSFEEFRRGYPQGKVLSRETGSAYDYGRNPYPGYEFGNGAIMPVRQRRQTSLRLMERLIVVRHGEGYRAYPLKLLARDRVLEDEVDSKPIVLFYSSSGVSPVDEVEMARSRRVGCAGVFGAEVDGRRLRFRPAGAEFEDLETKTLWSLTGIAQHGHLKNRKLQPVEHGIYFTFAWLAFRPDTEIVGETPQAGETGR